MANGTYIHFACIDSVPIHIWISFNNDGRLRMITMRSGAMALEYRDYDDVGELAFVVGDTAGYISDTEPVKRFDEEDNYLAVTEILDVLAVYLRDAVCIEEEGEW